jgi:riboflavin kinase/FMN adenylyltransferase
VGGIRISSSLIRELLSEGELEKANDYLGYTYFLQGKVVGGNRLGRNIGFPTANIAPHDFHKLIPKDGVYAVRVEVDGKRHKGMLNVGYRPTVTNGESEKTIEVHLIDFEEEIYGKHVTILFHYRMRDERKFEGIEQLTAQLVYDKVKAIELLKDLS